MENNKLEELLTKGNQFSFRNNSYTAYGEWYSKATDELQVWIVQVEDYILENYGENSSPYKLYKKFNPEYLNGYYESEFNKHYSIVFSSLKACKEIQPKLTSESYSTDQMLSIIFNRFHSVVKQLRYRYNSRPTIDIQDEYDVQDLLHSLLKLFYYDIRKEEWTPSYAGGSSRMDFLLKDEQTIIEVKKTRQGLSDKELGKQLIEDKAKYKAYPNCKKIICFVYDPDGRISNPKGLQNDLNSKDKDFIVEIIIKPE